jgi:hydrogenase-4 membrane subunit HyfE
MENVICLQTLVQQTTVQKANQKNQHSVDEITEVVEEIAVVVVTTDVVETKAVVVVQVKVVPEQTEVVAQALTEVLVNN